MELTSKNPYENTFLDIQNHLLNNTPISKEQEIILNRWNKAFNLLFKYKNKAKVAKALQKLEDENGHKIGRRQAYLDIKNAEILLGEFNKYEKHFLRFAVVEEANKDISSANKMAKRALKNGDHKLWELCMKIKDKAQSRIIEAYALSKDDPDVPDFDKLQPNNYMIGLDDRVLSMLSDMLNKSGSVDISSIIPESEYEELE